MTDFAEISQDDELSFFDVVDFVRKNWIPIIAACVLGIVAAAAYLHSVPRVYEATLQIEMARTARPENSRNTLGTPSTPVESASMLLERFRLPSTYTIATAKACGIDGAAYPLNELSNRVTPSAVRGMDAFVTITVQGESTDSTRTCAAAIFELIRHQQELLSRPYINDTKETITRLQKRFQENQNFLLTMEKSGMQSAAYLAIRDESIWLMDQIASLERALNQYTETRLVSPIYSTPHPVAPLAFPILAFAAAGGLLLGVIAALAWRQMKKHSASTKQT